MLLMRTSMSSMPRLGKFCSARQAQEGHTGFPSHGLGQEGLASPGRADQQDALGELATAPAIALWLLEKVDNFSQLGAGLVNASNTVKGYPGHTLHVDFGFVLPEAQETSSHTHAHAPQDYHPDHHEDQGRDHPGEQRPQPVVLDLPLELGA